MGQHFCQTFSGCQSLEGPVTRCEKSHVAQLLGKQVLPTTDQVPMG